MRRSKARLGQVATWSATGDGLDAANDFLDSLGWGLSERSALHTANGKMEVYIISAYVCRRSLLCPPWCLPSSSLPASLGPPSTSADCLRLVFAAGRYDDGDDRRVCCHALLERLLLGCMRAMRAGLRGLTRVALLDVLQLRRHCRR